MEHGQGSTRVKLFSFNASHTEGAVFENHAMLSGLASVSANVQTRKSTKIAKPEVNVAIRPDSLTYLFACGILVEAFAKRIFNFYNRKHV